MRVGFECGEEKAGNAAVEGEWVEGRRDLGEVGGLHVWRNVGAGLGDVLARALLA